MVAAEFEVFEPKEISSGLRQLQGDASFMRKLESIVGPNGTMREKIARLATKRRVAAKYLGIELDKGTARYSFSETVRLRLNPRGKDHSSKGLKMSNHAQAMHRELPKIAALLMDNDTFGPLCNDAVGASNFERSKFATAIRPVLKRLENKTGVPVNVSLKVLKKGSFAFGKSHRPGMSRYGWARARLSSFLFKGCTFFSPDHLLAQEAMDAGLGATEWWKKHPKCLCRKRAQCGRTGKSVKADDLPRTPSRGSRKPARRNSSRVKRKSRRG
jgi:hypothetical protein